jgi:hypothetical protein
MDSFQRVEGTGQIAAQGRTAGLILEQLSARRERQIGEFIQRGQSMRCHSGLTPLVCVKRIALSDFAEQEVQLFELDMFEVRSSHFMNVARNQRRNAFSPFASFARASMLYV